MEAPIITTLLLSFILLMACGDAYLPIKPLPLPNYSSNFQASPIQDTSSYKVVTLETHKLSDGSLIDCVHLIGNYTPHQFPKASSGWRRISRGAQKLFEQEVPMGCSSHEASLVVQHGDIFENITHHRKTPSTLDSNYAIYSSSGDGSFSGIVATLSINTPSVQDGEVSISQIWIIANRNDDNEYSTLEAGWIVYPSVFGDGDPRLFIYWTIDNYQQTGCFNRICPGFVQIDDSWTLGEKFPNGASVPGDSQQQTQFSVAIFRDPASGRWYLQIDTVVIGYWDPNIVTNFYNNNADEVQYGGEVQTGAQTSTQMGSGYVASAGALWAASQTYLHYLQNSLDLIPFTPDELAPFATSPSNYELGGLNLDSNQNVDGFFFGGPLTLAALTSVQSP